MLLYKAKQFMLTKKYQKCPHILKDATSGCASGDIEQVIVRNLE